MTSLDVLWESFIHHSDRGEIFIPLIPSLSKGLYEY